jgi:hypothetical protein
MRKKNVVVGPVGPETKNDSAGESQQQFIRLTDRPKKDII